MGPRTRQETLILDPELRDFNRYNHNNRSTEIWNINDDVCRFGIIIVLNNKKILPLKEDPFSSFTLKSCGCGPYLSMVLICDSVRIQFRW